VAVVAAGNMSVDVVRIVLRRFSMWVKHLSGHDIGERNIRNGRLWGGVGIGWWFSLSLTDMEELEKLIKRWGFVSRVKIHGCLYLVIKLLFEHSVRKVAL
jgi:hypothetical protein